MKNRVLKLFQIEIFSYLFVAGFTFFIDLLVFTICNSIIKFINLSVTIVISSIVARIISSLINYFLNRNVVFKKNDNKNYDKKSLIQYYSLVVVQLFMSTLLTVILNSIMNINATYIKFFVDICIFIVNFLVQKLIIFKNKE